MHCLVLVQGLQQKYQNDANVVILMLSCGTLADLTCYDSVLHTLFVVIVEYEHVFASCDVYHVTKLSKTLL